MDGRRRGNESGRYKTQVGSHSCLNSFSAWSLGGEKEERSILHWRVKLEMIEAAFYVRIRTHLGITLYGYWVKSSKTFFSDMTVCLIWLEMNAVQKRLVVLQ